MGQSLPPKRFLYHKDIHLTLELTTQKIKILLFVVIVGISLIALWPWLSEQVLVQPKPCPPHAYTGCDPVSVPWYRQLLGL